MKNTLSVMLFFIPIAAAVAFVGCAHLDSGQMTPREELIQRVNAYWNAKIKEQVEVAYSIEHPEGRKKVSIYKYARSSFSTQQASAKLLSFKILAVDLKGDKAIVSVQQETKITAPGLRTVMKFVRDDKWFKIDGEWYHEFTDSRALSDALIRSIRKSQKRRSQER